MAASVSSGGTAGGSGFDYYSQNAGEYYNQKGQTELTWHGKGLEAVGLKEGQIVEKQAFDNLEKGYSIDGTQALVYNAGRENHRGTYDITCSPDKSVSIAREFGAPEMRETINKAMNKAVLKTISNVETGQIQYRETHGNETIKVNSGNAIYAVAVHDVTRGKKIEEIDPGFHFHVVIMNMTQTADGGMKAIEPLETFRAQTLISRDFTNNLAKELVESGIAIEITKNGFKIQGISDEAIKEFSKRSQEMSKQYDKFKELYPNDSEAQLKEKIALATRPDKDMEHVTSESLKEEWAKREAALGINIKDELEKAQKEAKKNGQSITGGLDMDEFEAVKAAANDLTNKEAVVSKTELVAKALEYSVGVAVKADIEKAISEMQKTGELIERNGNFTTKEISEMQKSVETTMKAGIGAVESIAKNHEQIDNAVSNYEIENKIEFSKEQRETIDNILKSNDRFQDIQGVAGAGKTSMLDVINKVAKENGYNVIAVSFQGKAADEMSKSLGAGVESMTIESFKSYDLKSNDIVINDEASMTSLQDMKSIVDKVQASGARNINIGDVNQLQAVGAGKIFEESQRYGMTVSQLKESMRQKDPAYKDIVKDFNQGKIDKAFDKMQSQGKIHEVKGDTAFRQESLKQYRELSKKGDTKIVTNLNKDRQYFNKTIHNQYVKDGKVTDVKTFTVKENKNLTETQLRHAKNYEIGDVIFLKETAAGIGQKGAEFKVTEIDKVNNTLKLENIKVSNFHNTILNKSAYDVKDHTNFTDVVGKNKSGNTLQHTQTFSSITQAKDSVSVAGTKLIHTTYTLNLKDNELAKKIGGVARETQLEIGVGDEIKLTKNDKKFDVKNGQFGTVKAIKGDNVTVSIGKGKNITERTLNMKQYNHIDHAYAVTVNNFQGAKSDNIVAALKSQNATQNSTYTAITRGVNDYSVVTDNTQTLRENSQKAQVKTSASDMQSKANIRDAQRAAQQQSVRQAQQAMRAAQQAARAAAVSRAVQQQAVSQTVNHTSGAGR